MNNGFLDAQCGAGIWVEDAHPMNRAIKVPGSRHSNQIGELAAVLVTVQTAPRFADLTIITDSIYVIRAMNNSLKPWEDLGWTNIPNAEWLKATAYHLRQRSAPTRFKWVKGHNGTRGNEEADKLANIGVNKQTADEIDLTVPDHFQPTGLRLAATTQASAYALISGLNNPTTTRRAEILLERIRVTLETVNKHSLPNHSLWKGCRNRDIRRPIQTFIFKAINDALRIGDFWSRIPNLKHCARCHSCNAPSESLEHILLECDHPSSKLIWTLTERLWPTNTAPWPNLSLGLLLGCGNISIPTPEGQPPNRGPSRLLRILLSEASHLIWVLRCERTIQGTEHSLPTVATRWKNKINQRISTDRFLASFHKNKNFTPHLVFNTWTPSLQLQLPDLDPDWVVRNEVLVGINPTIP